MKRFIIVSVLVISTTFCFGQSLADKASSFLNKVFDKALVELDADSSSSDVVQAPIANDSSTSDVATTSDNDSSEQGTAPLIEPRTGKTSKGEDYTLLLFNIDETYVVFLDGYTDYNEIVEISYQTKELAHAAYTYRQILESVVSSDMPTFGAIINHVAFNDCNYSVDTFTTNDTTGLFYLIDYEDFLYFFR